MSERFVGDQIRKGLISAQLLPHIYGLENMVLVVKCEGCVTFHYYLILIVIHSNAETAPLISLRDQTRKVNARFLIDFDTFCEWLFFELVIALNQFLYCNLLQILPVWRKMSNLKLTCTTDSNNFVFFFSTLFLTNCSYFYCRHVFWPTLRLRLF